MIDPYAVLGVSPTATQAEITHAYRRLLRWCHPDLRSGEPDSGADERLRQVLSAYRVLRDPQLRNDYDRAVARVRKHRPTARIAVRRNDSAHVGAALWAGPVRWHR
ncbi:J domain-containing protein [Mycobacterium persicum]|uniref:Chaperone protein DnaJ n=1 Tax=Mycobacterium persicum TaxID=1487726 RepID=A0A1X0LEJ4_9MYCO|nr:J domain-containing protein [Mycobacterium persicum]KZS81835.1 hypothetical protein A4G31_20935 [Mycobacterium persicum]ORB54326.1 hypothetical protein BST40_07310 [Mycobacterium persicum]ORB91306.1 hypothetical protein B1T49_21060 [Mycobacterium persicum]ORB96601.1 hypothetical protein B1T44_21225 [Mycobacterium persicum]ORC03312.1 hypothetical protein B1T48_20790 [Mycobacterium persicum]